MRYEYRKIFIERWGDIMLLELDSKIKEINTYIKDKSLGNRMKEYENLTRFKLSKEYPMIIRLDGNAFHTFTKGFKRPFDNILRTSLEATAKYLLEKIPGSQLAYHQSDEISILVTNYQLSNREPWFDNNINKIISITASMATLEFNRVFSQKVIEAGDEKDGEKDISAIRYLAAKKGATFDSRALILPKEEVVNYFIWRQQDAIKNSISMVAQSLFSHKSLQGVNGLQMIQRMKDEKDIIYENQYTIIERRGSVTHRLEPVEHEKIIRVKDGTEKLIKYMRSSWGIDNNIPIFKDNKEYIEKFL